MNFDSDVCCLFGDVQFLQKNHIFGLTCLSTHIRSVFLSRNLNRCNGLNFLHIGFLSKKPSLWILQSEWMTNAGKQHRRQIPWSCLFGQSYLRIAKLLWDVSGEWNYIDASKMFLAAMIKYFQAGGILDGIPTTILDAYPQVSLHRWQLFNSRVLSNL